MLCMLRSAGIASPDVAEAVEQYRRGVELFRQRQPAKAAVELETSLKARPGQPNALKLLGLCYQLTGEPDKAEDAFEQAVDLAPKDSEAWFYLGRLYYNENFFAKARRALGAAVDLDTGDQRFHTYLGLTLEAAGETGEALRTYREAIQWNQKQTNPSFRPHYAYGVLLSKLDRLEEGKNQLLRARQLDPAAWEVRFELAKLQYKLGEYEHALRELQDALKTGSPTEEGAGRLYYLLARVYFKMGRDKEGHDALAMREKVGR